MKQKQSQVDLFLQEEEFQKIDENEINFPLFFRDKSGNKYLRYDDQEKFEQITISKSGHSFRGSILYGFDETIKQVKGDRKIWYYLLIRNHERIALEDYELFFSNYLELREKFFSTNEIEYSEPVIENQPVSKHKWKPIER